MKQESFIFRFFCALNGIRHTFASEANFRIQLLAALFAFGLFVWFDAEAYWFALLIITCAGVLALELLNTALEYALDHLHPEVHEVVGAAKDCAAAGVLVFSLASVGVALCFLSQQF